MDGHRGREPTLQVLRTSSVKIASSMAALAAILALTACGGSTKTVVQTVTATASTSTAAPAANTSSTSTTSTSSSGPQPCAAVLRFQDIKPTVCAFSNGIYLKAATENYPIKLKTLTVQFVGARSASSVSDSSGVASATANGTFEIITLRVTNNSSTPQTVESVGANSFVLETLARGSKTYSESFQAENGADQNSFVTNNSAPIQPDGSQTGDVVFDLPASGLASIRSSGAALLFGDFGTDLTTSPSATDPGHPYGFMIIHHVKLQG